MATTLTGDNNDTTLGTGLVDVVAAPAAGSEKRVALTICHTGAVGAADALVDLARVIGGTPRYMLRNVPVSVGKPVILSDVLLKAGSSLQAKASTGGVLDFTADAVIKTVTP